MLHASDSLPLSFVWQLAPINYLVFFYFKVFQYRLMHDDARRSTGTCFDILLHRKQIVDLTLMSVFVLLDLVDYLYQKLSVTSKT